MSKAKEAYYNQPMGYLSSRESIMDDYIKELEDKNNELEDKNNELEYCIESLEYDKKIYINECSKVRLEKFRLRKEFGEKIKELEDYIKELEDKNNELEEKINPDCSTCKWGETNIYESIEEVLKDE